ncbi:guanine deaminase [Streptomyces capparidis]
MIMDEREAPRWDRRRFLAGTGLAGTLGLAGALGGREAAAHSGGGRRTTVFHGTVLHFTGDPWVPGREGEDDPGAYRLFDPGALVVRDGTVVWAGHRHKVPAGLARHAHVVDHRGKLIVPGFVDCHVHSGQVDSIASPGGQLLPWLRDYMYPSEMRFADPGYARRAAAFFLDTLLAAGTTTASVYTTTHAHAAHALFAEAHRRGLCLVTGKVLMDDGAVSEGGAVPDAYLDRSVRQAEADTRALIDKWHFNGRLRYAVTPRFPLTSTLAALRMAGRLYREALDTGRPLWVQGHLAENRDEVDEVMRKFHDRLRPRSYLDVYDKCGLVGPRSMWGHSVWIDDTDRRRLAETGAGVAFNPTSNLFLGSGLFGLRRASRAGVRVGLGTDVGGGTSYSLLRTMGEAYKVVAMGNTYPERVPEDRRATLTGLRAFYLATLGGARALCLDDRVGSFRAGRDADFVVLDWAATPVLKRRTEAARDFRERLFVLATLGDERAVARTYVRGKQVAHRG